ncbi:membrane cofactor protein-like [Meriones unguiculatus]|uniref:membrane cofactor protein-like n=1 Tax=Meriones unguiculatus TaxID=10047 RepID=UPI000B4F40D1|nr:membrane cofactor protein-like [Meriones unguiculatus]
MPLQNLLENHSAQCFLVTLLVTLLSTSSDACGRPPTYQNMRLIGVPKTSYNPGEEVQYSCRPGYIRRTHLKVSSVCAENGTWSSISKDACYKKSCPRQEDPLNGQVELVNGSSEFGTQIQFVCNRGFILIGEKILYCLLDGSDVNWSNDPPICSKILCKPPPEIKNGTFSPSNKDAFEYHEVATYRCTSVPGGEDLSLVGESRIYCSENNSWSGDPPECKVVKCPYPVITNGRQTAGFSKKYSYKAVVILACNLGFFLHGSSTVMCDSDSTWQPPIPSCRSEPPPSPSASPPPPRTSSTTPAATPATTHATFTTKGASFDFRDSNGWIIFLIMMAVLDLQ